MKFSQVLFKQHIGRAIRKIWQTQRVRTLEPTNAENVLSSLGIPVKDAIEVANPKPVFPRIEFERIYTRPVFDNTHPDWKERVCLTFKDYNVPQEGIEQALLLTKTVQIDNKLPEQINDLAIDVPEPVHNVIKRIISNCTIYNAHQELLPKLKNPEKPMWVFPRQYGITATRRMRNISKNLIQLCETLSGEELVQQRFLLEDEITSTCVEKESDLMQFTLKMDLMMTSQAPLTQIANRDMGNDLGMPDLYPLHHVVGLEQTNVYKTDNVYPINAGSPYLNAHTIFVYHDPEEVKNITELPVTENQILSRALLKSFTAATSCARRKFGDDVKQLPEPVTIQCVQTDGQNYHFSVYQLNTLDIDGTEGMKNFWWSMPRMELYSKAQYEMGRPTLEGYNAEVFNNIYAFYKNR